MSASLHPPALQRRFIEIDGLRAIAISLVVLFHYAKEFYPDHRFFSFGWSGVDLFFVISGFVLYCQVKRRYFRDGKADYSSYFRNRALRIVPAYYASLIAMVLFFGFDKLFSANFLMHLSFLHIFDYKTAVSIQPLYWTLAVEVQFYLFIIAAAPLLAGRKGMAWMVGIIVLAIGYRIVFSGFVDPLSDAGLVLSNILPGRIAEFCYGMIVARIYLEMPSLLEKLRRPYAALLVFALSLTVLAFCWMLWLQRGDALFEHRSGAVLYYPFLGLGFGLLFLSVFLLPILRKVFSLRPLVFLGTISYSVYLWHTFVIMFMKQYLRIPVGKVEPATEMGMALLLTLIISTASYYLIEKTFLSFKK